MIKRVYYFVLLLLVALFSQFCANVVSPSGGIKDIKPPEIVEALPANSSVNFNSQKIILTFNEYVQLKNINQSLLISPPMVEKPTIKQRNKSVIIDLLSSSDSLNENTTYLLNFGDAIVDLNEGNALKNFRYVFSTGPYIDSLKVSGKVLNAFDLKAVEEGKVMLYESYKDSTPILDPPFYICNIEADGKFNLTNLRPGSYRIFYLKDANNNFRFDQPLEAIAFTDSIIIPRVEMTVKVDTIAGDSLKNDSIVFDTLTRYSPSDIILYSFIEERGKQYLVSSVRDEPWKLQFIFKEHVKEDVKLEPYNFNGTDWYNLEETPNRDTAIYWITDSSVYLKDTIGIVFTYPKTDSTGAISPYTDTLHLSYKFPEKQEKRRKEKKETNTIDTLIVKSTIKNVQDLNQDITFSVNHPIASFADSLFILTKLVDTNEIKVPFFLTADTLYPCRLHTKNSWESTQIYNLKLIPGAITDIYGFTNDTLKFRFSGQNSDYYSKIILSVSDVNPRLLFQLVDPKGEKVLRQFRIDESNHYEIEFLTPGKYGLKAILDENDNEKWDPGIFIENKQPERVFLYHSTIEIKSNFDMEIEWPFSF